MKTTAIRVLEPSYLVMEVGSDLDPIEAELDADLEPVKDCNGPAHHPSAPFDEVFIQISELSFLWVHLLL